MDVQFTTTTRENLPNLAIADGQIIAISDDNGYYYDMGGVRRSVGGFLTVTSLPESGNKDTIYLLAKGDFATPYAWAESTGFIPLSVDFITMTYAEYQQLTTEEKMDGRIRFITDRGQLSKFPLNKFVEFAQDDVIRSGRILC